MIACLFPGQGSQAVGMGKALADQFPICAPAVLSQESKLPGHSARGKEAFFRKELR